MNTYIISHISVKDFMRVSQFDAPMGPGLFLIGGKNANGKSSALRAVLLALEGGKAPKEPVRKGADKAEITLHFDTPRGKYKLVKTIDTGGDIKAIISNEDGMKMPPKKILDEWLGGVSADPLEFTRKSAADQVKELQAQFGLDLSDLDREERESYDARTATNKEIAKIAARRDEFNAEREKIDAAPDDFVSVSALTNELEKASEHNKQGDALKSSAERAELLWSNACEKHQKVADEIADLRDRLTDAEERLKNYEIDRQTLAEARDKANESVKAFEPIDTDPITYQIAIAETTNRFVRLKQDRAKLRLEYKEAQEESDNLTRRVEAARLAKRERIAALELPVEGLAFEVGDDDKLSLLYKGLPFEQASSAEQLAVSVPLAFAKNRLLKFAYIKDGSLLDEDSLALVTKLVEDAGAQLIMERVGHGEECDVILIDGKSYT
jgi:hypothetical protein